MAISNYYITCILKRPNHTLNEALRDIVNYSNITIKGYIGSQTDLPYLVANKWTSRTRYKFFTDHFDISQGDFIEYLGSTYEVMGDMKNTANLNHHGRIYLQKVEGVKR